MYPPQRAYPPFSPARRNYNYDRGYPDRGYERSFSERKTSSTRMPPSPTNQLKHDNGSGSSVLYQTRQLIKEVRNNQKNVLEVVGAARKAVEALNAQLSDEKVVIFRDCIPYSDPKLVVVHTQINSDIFLQWFNATQTAYLGTLARLGQSLSKLQSLDPSAFLASHTSTAAMLPTVEENIARRVELCRQIAARQAAIEQAFAGAKEPRTPAPQPPSLKSLPLDLEQCLNLNNLPLLVAYLESVDPKAFLECAFSTDVLLSLLSFLTSDLTTDHFDTKVTFILCSLTLLQPMTTPPRFRYVFRSIQSAFLTFPALLETPQYHAPVLRILALCEEVLSRDVAPAK